MKRTNKKKNTNNIKEKKKQYSWREAPEIFFSKLCMKPIKNYIYKDKLHINTIYKLLSLIQPL